MTKTTTTTSAIGGRCSDCGLPAERLSQRRRLCAACSRKRQAAGLQAAGARLAEIRRGDEGNEVD